MKISTVAVIGAGVIGCGVAQSVAEAGIKVLLVDVSDEALQRAREDIRQNLRWQRLLSKESLPHSTEDILALITFSQTNDLLNQVDFVIENVTEDWATKAIVYPQLDALCQPHCVFAANTSAIPIGRLAALTQRPTQVIGLHFMNPVPLKSTVELIRGPQTSVDTVEQTEEFLTRLGKQWVTVNDAPGFVSNRVLMLAVNEAIQLVAEGIAPAEGVDRIFKECFGHPLGPLETADLIGLDTILNTLLVLSEALDAAKFSPSPLLQTMVDEGRLGRKSGQGFYEYAYTGTSTNERD